MESPLFTLIAGSRKGGILRSTLRLADAFDKKGYQVHVLVKDPGIPFHTEIAPTVRLVKIRTFNSISGLPFLAWYIFKFRPSVILTGVFQHTVLAMQARSLTGSTCRVFTVVRNPYSAGWANQTRARFSLRVKKLKKYYPRTDGIIAVSHGVAHDFHQLTGIARQTITTIYNPAFDDRIMKMMLEPVDHPWFQGEKSPVALYVGRFERQKNLFLLIEAFEKLRSRRPCRLMLIGDGSMRTDLEKRVSESPCEDDIAFLGHLPNPYPYMRMAGVVTLSSSWEGFGNVLIEALATGTPVVGTDCPGGPAEIIGKGQYGRLVPPDDSEAMAFAMDDLLRTPPPQELMLEAAENFKTKTIADQYLHFFGFGNSANAVAGGVRGT